MSIRFAPAAGSAYHLSSVLLSPRLARRAQRKAANDDRASVSKAAFDPTLAEALRHFARHGMNAARSAYDEAELAKAHSDLCAFEHWLAITRNFDPRLARQLEGAALQHVD